MNEIIKSNQNKWIKHLKSLQLKKYRDHYNEYIIEGAKLLGEAFTYNAKISFVAFNEKNLAEAENQEIIKKCHDSNIPYYFVEDRLFNETCETQTPQGIIAVVSKSEQNLDELMNKDTFSFVVLDEVRDPGNVGTIIRTADACNLSAVILSKGSADIYNGKTVRSAMGSIFHIPIITDVDMIELIEKLHENSAESIGADPHAEMSCFELPKYMKTAIFIGNEANGLSEEVEKSIRHNVCIPMPGKAESLNAAVAAALMMYEISVRKYL